MGEEETTMDLEPEFKDLLNQSPSLVSGPICVQSSTQSQLSKRLDMVESQRLLTCTNVENGTPSIRLSPTNTKTEMFRTLPSTLSLMEETCRMTLLYCSPQRTLFWTNILTLLVCQLMMSLLMEPPVLPLDGVRISLELLENTKLCSRKLICQLLAMDFVRSS